MISPTRDTAPLGHAPAEPESSGSWARALRYCCWGLFCLAAAAFAMRMLHGPFTFIQPVTSPLNAESILAISFLVLLFLRSTSSTAENRAIRPSGPAGPRGRPGDLTILCCLFAITAAAFYPTIKAPLLHDSYSHVIQSASMPWFNIPLSFVKRPVTGDFFFRPVGDLSYWLDVKWASSIPGRWHLWNLCIHLAGVSLAYILAHQLLGSRTGASVTALVFALHGTRPEVVSWMAARYDLLATFFTLICLVATCRYGDSGNRQWIWLIAISSVLAAWSKESAYCLPLLIFGLSFWKVPSRPNANRRRVLYSAALVAILLGMLLIHRLWLLGTIGGYRSLDGREMIQQFSLLRTLKALFFRQWSILFFPVNWAIGPEPVLKALLLLWIGLLSVLALTVKVPRRQIVITLFLVLCAALPVQHMLLLGTDLNGGRVLYLPVLALGLFWGVAASHWEPRRNNVALPLAFLIVNYAVLSHNLRIWKDVAIKSQTICQEFGSTLAKSTGPVLVKGLPADLNGIYFLKNGFPECVALNTGQDRSRVTVDPAVPPRGSRVFAWDSRTLRLKER